MNGRARQALVVGAALGAAAWLFTLEPTPHADPWQIPPEAPPGAAPGTAEPPADPAASDETRSGPRGEAAPVQGAGGSLGPPDAGRWRDALRVDAVGHFVPTPRLRELFEDFHARAAGHSDLLVRGRIVLLLLDELPPRAADEAIDVLDRWQRLREALREAAPAAAASAGGAAPPASGADAAADARVRALRQELLGASLERALYGS